MVDISITIVYNQFHQESCNNSQKLYILGDTDGEERKEGGGLGRSTVSSRVPHCVEALDMGRACKCFEK